MEKMLKNEVAKNELKEVRHSEEWHKSGEKVKYRLADAMKSCMKKAPVEKITPSEGAKRAVDASLIIITLYITVNKEVKNRLNSTRISTVRQHT